VKPGTFFSVLESEPKTTFRAVLACEDDASIKTGTEICRLLLSCFENRLPFHIQIWPFDIFQSGHPNRDAVHDAIEADAIIVATHQQDDLPLAIKEWISAWVPQKRAQTAILIGLFHHPGGSLGMPFASFDYLKKAAKDAGIDFLVQQSLAAEDTSMSSPIYIEPPISPRPEGWGLND